MGRREGRAMNARELQPIPVITQGAADLAAKIHALLDALYALALEGVSTCSTVWREELPDGEPAFRSWLASHPEVTASDVCNGAALMLIAPNHQTFATFRRDSWRDKREPESKAERALEILRQAGAL